MVVSVKPMINLNIAIVHLIIIKTSNATNIQNSTKIKNKILVILIYGTFKYKFPVSVLTIKADVINYDILFDTLK